MEESQIKTIIESGENQEIELKQSFHSSQDISKAICGFANTLGGILLIGVTDSKKIIGVNDDLDKLQQQISAANQSVSPVPLISIEIFTLDNKKIIAIIVQKSPDNTYNTFHGAIYIRVGSTTKRIDGQTHLEFLRNRQILSFDENYELNAKTDDLDVEKIKSYLQERKQSNYLNEHSVEEFLLSSKLASLNGKFKIKNPAILLFGKNPTNFLPQSEVKLVQFLGTEAVNILAHRLIQEDLIETINQSMAFIEKTLSKSIQIKESAKRIEKYEYPINVIRESIVNAVVHRDYFSRDAIQIYIFDDRIEITDPGSLPSNLPKEMFGTISVQRNPITYRFLRDLGFVEGLGTGIPRMKNAMREAGLSDPEFKITESFFRVVLYNSKGSKHPIHSLKDLSIRQKKALEYVKKHKIIKAQTYVEINKVSYATAVNDINELIEYGFLKKVGSYRGAYYVLEEDE
ncbi:putative DNA binding domain-containing protein [Candidatus Woesearchaeota archaeon]|nr:putative DNA binding domain-containing protein [Candidatus Woesearchaeota archaeon]